VWLCDNLTLTAKVSSDSSPITFQCASGLQSSILSIILLYLYNISFLNFDYLICKMSLIKNYLNYTINNDNIGSENRVGVLGVMCAEC